MPLKPFLFIFLAVIGLAALTVAAFAAVFADASNPSVAVMAGVSVVTLLGSALVRRFGPRDSDP